MSLAQRTEMRRCGRRYKTRTDAALSKGALVAGKIPFECPLRSCGGWHLREPGSGEPSGMTARKPPKDTGPDRKRRRAVLARDGWRCVRCGKPCGPDAGPYSIQHRIARGVGGGSQMTNLILLCGSATTGCHGEVESKADRHDNAAGYWLESWQDPRAEGVMYAEPDGSGITRWLADDGSLLNEPAERAA